MLYHSRGAVVRGALTPGRWDGREEPDPGNPHRSTRRVWWHYPDEGDSLLFLARQSTPGNRWYLMMQPDALGCIRTPNEGEELLHFWSEFCKPLWLRECWGLDVTVKRDNLGISRIDALADGTFAFNAFRGADIPALQAYYDKRREAAG